MPADRRAHPRRAAQRTWGRARTGQGDPRSEPRALPGDELDRVSFPVERGKVREFVRAVLDDNPIYTDAAAAREAGFDGIPAPLTFSVIADHWQDRDPTELLEQQLGVDVARLLHGEASWEYLAPVLVDDELTAVRRLVDVRTVHGRRGGEMRIFTIETEVTNQRGKVVMCQRDELIETGA